jgi:dUTPase
MSKRRGDFSNDNSSNTEQPIASNNQEGDILDDTPPVLEQKQDSNDIQEVNEEVSEIQSIDTEPEPIKEELEQQDSNNQYLETEPVKDENQDLSSLIQPEVPVELNKGPIIIKISKVVKSDVPYPSPAEEINGAYDLYADFTSTPFPDKLYIPGGSCRTLPTNIIFEVPEGMVCVMQDAAEFIKTGLTVKGYINSKTTGFEVAISNNRNETAEIKHGQKIAQIYFIPILTTKLEIK